MLASPELRKQYDAHGTEGLDANLVDGALFFTCLFGSDRFEHLIGELMIAVAARSGGDLNIAAMKDAQVCWELFRYLGTLWQLPPAPRTRTS